MMMFKKENIWIIPYLSTHYVQPLVFTKAYSVSFPCSSFPNPCHRPTPSKISVTFLVRNGILAGRGRTQYSRWWEECPDLRTLSMLDARRTLLNISLYVYRHISVVLAAMLCMWLVFLQQKEKKYQQWIHFVIRKKKNNSVVSISMFICIR